MTPFRVQFFLTFILVFELKEISGQANDDYWSINFDASQNCENEGRHQIYPALFNFSLELQSIATKDIISLQFDLILGSEDLVLKIGIAYLDTRIGRFSVKLLQC